MKYFFYTIAIMLVISFNANAQQNNSKSSDINIKGFAAKIEHNNLLINWTSIETGVNNYWEVQGSKDGKEFSTIGLVLGADPVTAKVNYEYKQQLTKIRPGFKYYRILHVEAPDRAVASNTIGLTK